MCIQRSTKPITLQCRMILKQNPNCCFLYLIAINLTTTRIPESFRLERTSSDHLAQPPAQRLLTFNYVLGHFINVTKHHPVSESQFKRYQSKSLQISVNEIQKYSHCIKPVPLHMHVTQMQCKRFPFLNILVLNKSHICNCCCYQQPFPAYTCDFAFALYKTQRC